jgi:hypothetical protein
MYWAANVVGLTSCAQAAGHAVTLHGLRMGTDDVGVAGMALYCTHSMAGSMDEPEPWQPGPASVPNLLGALAACSAELSLAVLSP